MTNINNDYTPLNSLTPFKLCVLQNFPFIEADFDAVTNYQLLCKVVEYLNKVIDNNNKQNSNITQLEQNFITLYNYVKDYFNNLDVQDEINKKIDEMVSNGTFNTLLSNYTLRIYSTVADMINDKWLKTNMCAMTQGYYSINDGGGAYYVITTNKKDYSIKLDNNLFAELIINNNSIKEFGTKNENDSEAVKNALIYGKNLYIDSDINLDSDISNTEINANIYISSDIKIINDKYMPHMLNINHPINGTYIKRNISGIDSNYDSAALSSEIIADNSLGNHIGGFFSATGSGSLWGSNNLIRMSENNKNEIYGAEIDIDNISDVNNTKVIKGLAITGYGNIKDNSIGIEINRVSGDNSIWYRGLSVIKSVFAINVNNFSGAGVYLNATPNTSEFGFLAESDGLTNVYSIRRNGILIFNADSSGNLTAQTFRLGSGNAIKKIISNNINIHTDTIPANSKLDIDLSSIFDEYESKYNYSINIIAPPDNLVYNLILSTDYKPYLRLFNISGNEINPFDLNGNIIQYQILN